MASYVKILKMPLEIKPLKLQKISAKLFLYYFKGPQITRAVRKEQSWNSTSVEFKPYYKILVIKMKIKMRWHWHKNRHIWQRNRWSELNSSIDDWITFHKSVVFFQWSQASFFSKWCWMTKYKEIKLVHYPMLYININSE